MKLMKQFIVVAYDVADDSRRRKIAKILEQYGVRCNESVFECLLKISKINKMKQQLIKYSDENEDIILFYYLCKSCSMKRESIGSRPQFNPEIIEV